jgi:CHRD domain-containing protein
MRRRLIVASVAVFVAASAAVTYAQGGFKNIKEILTGYQEVPAISTTGSGELKARISNDGSEIEYELSYADLEGSVLQSHIHIGQPGVNGGIMLFLCSNLGNGPAGTQACPPPPATITGVLTASNVIGPTAQGIEPGAFAEVIQAIRAGSTYVNVHSSKWPGGEIRKQINGNTGQ